MTDINKVRTNTPLANAIKKLQENDDIILGLAEADRIDYLDIIDIMSGTGNKSRFERNVQLGHTLFNYTSWSGVSNEAGYTIWRYPLTNFADHNENKLYIDDIPLTYRGLATSESVVSFDKVYIKSGTTYTDNTIEAGTTQGISFGLMSAATDDLYIGDVDVFSGIDFNFNTLGYNYNLGVYYFNGAWTELSANSNDLLDDTKDFSSNGRITWDVPSDWISGTFNSQNKKWIKISTSSNPVSTAKAYHIMPMDSVSNLLSLSSDDVVDKQWAWCHFNNNLYTTLKNAGGVGYEGREWLTRDSTDTNKQNYFVYNHELKTTYQRDDWNAPTGIGEESPQSGTFTGLRVAGKSSFGDNLEIANGKTIGQAAGPLLTFDDTNNRLEITGCDVGIGTTGPEEKLDVYGNVKLRDATITLGVRALAPTGWGYSPNGYRVVQVGAASGDESVAIGYNPSVNAGSGFAGDGSELIFRRGVRFTTPNADNTAWYTSNLVLKDGNVGIGTMTPLAYLDISSGKYASAGGFRLGADIEAYTRTNATRKIGLVCTPHYTAAEENVLDFWVDSDSTVNTLMIGGGLGHHNAMTSIQFWTGADNITTGGTERLRIDGNGNVGIGTTTPSVALNVSGTMHCDAFRLNQVPTSSTQFSGTHTLTINCNGVNYKLLCVAA